MIHRLQGKSIPCHDGTRTSREFGNPVYRIPVGLFESGVVQTALAKANKVATKLGMDPIQALVTTEPIERIIDVPGSTFGRVRLELEVVLVGDAPRVEGYELVARLEHTPQGNLISSRSALPEGTLSVFRHVAPVCEHCGMRRNRLDTFLVRETATGDIKQIGRNCLADYIRSAEADGLVKLWKYLDTLTRTLGGADEDDDGCGGGWGRYNLTTTLHFIACAVSSVRRHGFKPSQQEGSTRGHAGFLCGPCPADFMRDSKREWLEGQPTAEDVERARAIIEWADTIQGGSDYEHNLRIACLSPAVLDKAAGLLASAPSAYDRAMGHAAKQAEAKAKTEGITDEPLAAEKTRVRNLHAHVLRVRRFDRDDGRSVYPITLLVEREGKHYRLLWWASNKPELVVEGAYVRLTATVKRFERDKRDGKGQTLVTRCIVEAPEEQANAG